MVKLGGSTRSVWVLLNQGINILMYRSWSAMLNGRSRLKASLFLAIWPQLCVSWLRNRDPKQRARMLHTGVDDDDDVDDDGAFRDDDDDGVLRFTLVEAQR
ncbi:hypothetical protein VNO77_03646 [Canavalia gladiata]|uniref:Uncharacterized protein n=1 Tax=Canavalia gladiata TaxID=3824 RepID=A0AAN9MVW7_CANGL